MAGCFSQIHLKHNFCTEVFAIAIMLYLEFAGSMGRVGIKYCPPLLPVGAEVRHMGSTILNYFLYCCIRLRLTTTQS